MNIVKVEDYFGNQAGLYGVKSSSNEADFVKNMNIYQRSIDMVSFAKDSFPESEFQVGLTAWILCSGSPQATVQVSTQAGVSSETRVLFQDHNTVGKIQFLQL